MCDVSAAKLMSSISFYLLRMLRRYMKLKEDMPLLSGEDRGRYFGKLVFCIKTNVIYLPLSSSTSLYLPRMLRRYMKLKEDMPLSAAKIEDDTLASAGSASRLMSFISLYLLLPPSTSFYFLPLSARQAKLAKENKANRKKR